MNATIQGIIDHMFRDTAVTAETRALHEELLNNCLEHYSDLIARGMSETVNYLFFACIARKNSVSNFRSVHTNTPIIIFEHYITNFYACHYICKFIVKFIYD